MYPRFASPFEKGGPRGICPPKRRHSTPHLAHPASPRRTMRHALDQAKRMPATTRRATLAALDSVAPRVEGYRVFYAQPIAPPRARDWLEQCLRRDESVVLVAEREGTVVGFAQLYPSF